MLNNTSTRVHQLRNDDGGFTLIELLIVIVILGVLAGIVVFSVRGITDRGEASACKSEVATVETAAEAYYAKEGNYPTFAELTDPDDGFLKSAPTYVLAADYAAGSVSTVCPS